MTSIHLYFSQTVSLHYSVTVWGSVPYCLGFCALLLRVLCLTEVSRITSSVMSDWFLHRSMIWHIRLDKMCPIQALTAQLIGMVRAAVAVK